MKKVLFLLVLVTSWGVIVPNPQKDGPSRYIKGDGFEGFVFGEDEPCMCWEGSHQQYSPSDADILLAESILKQQLEDLNKNFPNQGHGCPIITKSLKKYTRQYFGAINEKGEKCLWINMLYGSPNTNNLASGVFLVNDGCSYYWNIKVNLEKRQAYDLYVNGSA